MNKKTRMVLIILSTVVILNVMFVPIFNVWEGLFPSDIKRDFFDVLECFFEDDDAWDLWVVQLSISFFVSAVLMLIMSLIGHKGLFVTANIIAIVVWFKQIIVDYVGEDGFDALLDFEDGNISIGTWTTIMLFVTSFIIVLSSKKKEYGYPNLTILKSVERNISENVNSCSACGAFITEGCTYCNYCGTKIKLSTIVNEELESQSIKMKVCSNCNSAVAENAIFCTNCGVKL